MKAKLVLISHGNYALEVKRSAEMIVGSVDNVYTISMLESDGLEGTRRKLQEVLDEIGDAEVVIATDIMSGTPCNAAVQAMFERGNVWVLTGLNLSMVIEYSVMSQERAEEMAEALRDVGKMSVTLVAKPEPADGKEGYED